MGLDQMMLWRFKNIEGVLADIKSWNMNECVFNDNSKISYDQTHDIVTIERKHSVFNHVNETMPISACTKQVLIEHFGFAERYDNRHDLSYGKQDE